MGGGGGGGGGGGYECHNTPVACKEHEAITGNYG